METRQHRGIRWVIGGWGWGGQPTFLPSLPSLPASGFVPPLLPHPWLWRRDFLVPSSWAPLSYFSANSLASQFHFPEVYTTWAFSSRNQLPEPTFGSTGGSGGSDMLGDSPTAPGPAPLPAPVHLGQQPRPLRRPQSPALPEHLPFLREARQKLTFFCPLWQN